MPTEALSIFETEPLSARNFERLAELIQRYSGIKMPSSKRTMLEGRLRRRMRAYDEASVNDYCRRLFEENLIEDEIVQLIDVVTTNKTDFFREPAHFDYLSAHILPTFADGGRRELKVWSAAASTGAEAYTLAMILEDFSERHRDFRYSILGTDICTDVLEQATAGRFAEAMIEPVPMDFRRRYVLKSRDPKRREVRMAPNLRQKTSFARMNLMDERYPVPDAFDLIFCRNVLIYFDKPTQAMVLKRLCSHLRVGGHLFLGHSESIAGAQLPVRSVANTIFQRV